MNAAEILKAIESQITDKEVQSMVRTYKNIIRDYVISGNEEMAKRYALKLAAILEKYPQAA